MNKLFVTLLTIVSLGLSAQVKIGTAGDIEPVGSFAAMKMAVIEGGYHVLNDTSDLEDYLKPNAVVLQLSDTTAYFYAAPDWVEVPGGGGPGGSHTHAAADITSGTFANARISQSSVIQHQAALQISHTQVSDYDTELAGKTNTTAFTPTGDYHPATKKYVDDEITAAGGYNDEAAQDAVGNILSNSSEISWSYADGTPAITATIIAGSIDESKLDASTNASLTLANSALQSEVDGSTTNEIQTLDVSQLVGTN